MKQKVELYAGDLETVVYATEMEYEQIADIMLIKYKDKFYSTDLHASAALSTDARIFVEVPKSEYLEIPE